MKLQGCATVCSPAEYRALRIWCTYVVLSTLLIVGVIAYYEINTQMALYAQHKEIASLKAFQSELAEDLQRKTKLKQEVKRVSKQHADFTRIRQQQCNPYQFLSQLYNLFGTDMQLLTYVCDKGDVQLTIRTTTRERFNQFMQQAAAHEMESLHIQSIELLADNQLHIKLSTHL